ncbi:hypothetical protein ACJJI4_17060 [Microbulbifer sp. TRSA002]|uniref:hypothetical protein n=1 Tax=Microbulbifer sp. TRSA002 TaxID=3243382 RepID=UPI00403A223F
MTEKTKDPRRLSPAEKQIVPLPEEVDPKDVAMRARIVAFQHMVKVKHNTRNK